MKSACLCCPSTAVTGVYLAVGCLVYLVEPTGLTEIPVGIKIEGGGLRTAVPIAPVT